MTKRGLRRLAALAVSVVIAAAAMGGALLVKQGMARKELASRREQGLALYHAGEYKAALGPLGQYVARVKNDPEVLIAFGLSRQKIPLPNNRHIFQSIAALKAAIDLEPTNLSATESLMDLFAQAGYLTELVEIADTILDLEPTHERALINRTEALITLGLADEAIASSSALVAAHGDLLIAHDLHVKALRLEGRPIDVQIEAMRRHEDRFADHPGFFDRLSRLEWDSGNRAEAIRLARHAASLAPRSARQVAILVDWLRALDRATSITGMISPPDDADQTADQRSLVELADQLFSRAIEDDAIGPFLAIEATKRAWWQNQSDLARQYAVRLSDPVLAGDREAEGWAALVAISERDETITDPAGTAGPADPAGTSSPPATEPGDADSENGDDWSIILSAMESLVAGVPEQALLQLESIEPASEETGVLSRYLHGLSLQRIGDLLGASTAYRDVLERRGIDRDRALKSLGEVLAGLGMYKESESIYRRMMRRDAVPAHTRIDLYLSQLEEHRDPVVAQMVLRAIREAMSINPDSPDVKVRLSRTLILAGRVEQGLEEARLLLADGVAPDPAGLLGLCWTLEGFDKPLVLELLAAFQTGTDNADLLFVRALILARSGDLDSARAMIEAEIESHSGSEAIAYLRSLARLLDRYDKEAALEVFRRLSDEYEQSATAQLAVLEGIAPWSDLDLIHAAVARLRNVAGESSLSWRVYEARMVLAENPSDNELSHVVLSLRDVLEADPDDFYSLFLTAKAYMKFSEGHRARGSTTEVAENITLAASYFDRAVGPASRAVAYRPYIEMLLDNGRAFEAESVLDRFMAEDNIPYRCRADRIELLTRLGRWRDAIEDQAWFATSGDPTTILNLAELHARSGEDDRAREIIEEFVSQPDRAPDQLLRVARIFSIMDDFGAATEILGSLPEQTDLGPRNEVTGKFFMSVRRPDLALPFLTEFARASSSVEAWVAVIQAATGAGQQETAASLLAEARQVLPDAPELAVFDTESPSRRSAQIFASSVGPEAPQADRELARIAEEHAMGRLDEQGFIEQLSTYTKTNPHIYAAWRLLTITHQSLGEIDRAIDACRACVRALPNDPRPLRVLARLLGEYGRIDEAIDTTRALADLLFPETYEADVMTAELELMRGRFKDAVNRLVVHRAQLRAQSSERPTRGFVTYVLALAGSGDTDEISQLIEEHWTSNDNEWVELALRAIGTLPVDLRDTKRQWLRRITDDRYALVRAELWVQIGRYSGERSDAIHATELFEAHGDSSPGWRFVLAEIDALSDRLTRAEQAYRKLIEEFPDTAESYIRLAELLARQPARANEAISFIDSAMSRFGSNPNSAGYRSLQLARARAMENTSPTAARSEYEHILEDDPASQEAAIGLARLLLKEGDEDRARELLELVSEPDMLVAGTRFEYNSMILDVSGP